MNRGYESVEQTCTLGLLDVDEDCMSDNKDIYNRGLDVKGESTYGKSWGSTRHMHISLQTSHVLTAHAA